MEGSLEEEADRRHQECQPTLVQNKTFLCALHGALCLSCEPPETAFLALWGIRPLQGNSWA